MPAFLPLIQWKANRVLINLAPEAGDIFGIIAVREPTSKGRPSLLRGSYLALTSSEILHLSYGRFSSLPDQVLERYDRSEVMVELDPSARMVLLKSKVGVKRTFVVPTSWRVHGKRLLQNN